MALSDDSKIDLNNFDTHIMTAMKTSSKHHRIKWSLKGYSKLPVGREFESSLIKPLPAYQWSMVFVKEANDRRLYFVNKSGKELELELELSLGDLNGKRWFHKIEAKSIFSKDCKKDILPTTNNIANELNNLCEDTLIMVCSFRIHLKSISETLEVEDGVLPMHGPEKLLADLKTMYVNHQYTDLTLITGEEQLRVHKSIICARSPVFERMFQHRMEEKETNTVQVNDVKLPIMKKLVDFLYSGVYEDDDDIESAYALYYAADKYEVLDLRKRCTDAMLRQLTVNNTIQVLIWANRHEDEYLKNKAHSFFMHHFDAITDTDAWDEFMTSETKLALEMIKHYTRKLKDY